MNSGSLRSSRNLLLNVRAFSFFMFHLLPENAAPDLPCVFLITLYVFFQLLGLLGKSMEQDNLIAHGQNKTVPVRLRVVLSLYIVFDVLSSRLISLRLPVVIYVSSASYQEF